MTLQASINAAKSGVYGPLPVTTAPTGSGTSAVQRLTFTGPITGGSFKLSFGGIPTGNLLWSATNATLVSRIDTALERLSTVGSGNITTAVNTMTAGIGTIDITFIDQKAELAVDLIEVESDDLTGGGSVAVSEVTPGVDAPLRDAPIGAIAVTTDVESPGIYQKQTDRSWGTAGIISVVLGSPALGTTTAVHAAVTDTGSPQTVTTAITNPTVARNITATAGGTAGDIKAISVTITGTDINGEVLTEVLPAFTVDTPGTVVGSKAFLTVTSIALPVHDGTGATTAIGVGAALGLDRTFSRDTILAAFLGSTPARESTRPTVAVHGTNVSSNTVQLASPLNGTPVRVDFYR
jgi:hypothetical protein